MFSFLEAYGVGFVLVKLSVGTDQNCCARLGPTFFFEGGGGGGEGEEETLGLYRQGGRLGEKSWVCPNMRWAGEGTVCLSKHGEGLRERERPLVPTEKWRGRARTDHGWDS